MFTGIIEEIGTIDRYTSKWRSYRDETSRAKHILEDVQLGDSISVNGVCLTVTSFTKEYFTVDFMPETVSATSLQGLGRGSKVNLRAGNGCKWQVWWAFCFWAC